MKFGVPCPGSGSAPGYMSERVYWHVFWLLPQFRGPVRAAGSQQDALVVVNDRGGLLDERNVEISKLAAIDQRVELRGTCLSG